MTLEEFLGKYSDAKSARNTAMEKVKAALEELNSAENQLDSTMNLLGDGQFEVTDYSDLSLLDGSLFDELLKPAKAMSKLFGGFGDLF